MERTRRFAWVWVVLVVAVIVAVVSGAVFLYQYATAYSQCAAVPGANPCASVGGPQIAIDSAFISLFGLLVAIVLAISAGVERRGLSVPNIGLARRLEQEDREYKRQQALLERQQQAQLEAAREEAIAAATAQAATGGAAAAAETTDEAIVQASATATEAQPESEPLIAWEVEEERPVDDARRRALEERLKSLAKRKPEVIAEVLSGWIEQGKTP